MMDVLEIQKLLPHRYPFLLVDRVVSIEPGKALRAYKNVTVNEPFFNGHFPGHPVMPGVLVLEALAQASAILVEATLSYLGLGVPEPYPSWGRMLSVSAAEYAQKAPWLVLFPGMAISLAVFGSNLLGDALRDTLVPRLRGA